MGFLFFYGASYWIVLKAELPQTLQILIATNEQGPTQK